MPVARLFWHLVLPGSVSRVAFALYIVFDGMFVGHCMGHDALAAITMMWPLIAIFFAVSDMISTGSSVQISVYLGKKDSLLANRTFTTCLALIIAISMLFSTMGYFLSYPYLEIMGVDSETRDLSLEYIIPYCISAPFISVFFATDHYLRVCGKQRLSMWINVFVSLFNLLLDYIFIVELRLGVWSASMTTCVALSTGSLMSFSPFLMRKADVFFTRGWISLRTLWRICYNGSSELLMSTAGALFMFLVNALLLSIGGNAAVAATAAVMYLDSVSVMLLIGMSDAMQPAISYCYGAGRLLRVLSLQRWLIKASALVGLFFFCFLEFIGPCIMPLYAPAGDAEFSELAVRCVRIFAFTYLFIWLDVTLHSFLTALDCPSYSFILSFSKAILVPLAGLYLLAYFWGLDGIWANSAAAALLTAGLAVFLVRRLWKKDRDIRLPSPV